MFALLEINDVCVCGRHGSGRSADCRRRTVAPVCGCCSGAAVGLILSAVRLHQSRSAICTVQFPYEAVTDNVTFLITQRVNMCETARISTSDPFRAPAASPSFSTPPSPQTTMFLQMHSQLFGGFLMGKTCKAKCFPFATFVKFVSARSSHLMLNGVYMLLTH